MMVSSELLACHHDGEGQSLTFASPSLRIAAPGRASSQPAAVPYHGMRVPGGRASGQEWRDG